MEWIGPDHEPGERYAALRVISLIFTGIGVILLVAGTLLLAFGLYFLASQLVAPIRGGPSVAAPPVGGVVPFLNILSPFVILWALGPLGAGLQFLAMGYLIRLAIQVEENTRTSARCLEKLSARAEPRSESPGPLFVS